VYICVVAIGTAAVICRYNTKASEAGEAVINEYTFLILYIAIYMYSYVGLARIAARMLEAILGGIVHALTAISIVACHRF
jgi:hypothetical protein